LRPGRNLALLAGCLPQAGQGTAPDTIKVGAIVPLTGRYGSLGEQIRNGYELAVDAINRDGGVNVRQFGKKIPLELRLLDDESDPTKTVQRAESLYAENIVAYLGGAGSDLHAAAAPIAEKNKTPYRSCLRALSDSSAGPQVSVLALSEVSRHCKDGLRHDGQPEPQADAGCHLRGAH
jgi:Periplasmic binding protein